MTLRSEADKLVEHIAKKAMAEKTPFPEAVDALKAITAYLTMDAKKKPAGEDDGNPSFETFRQGLQDTNDATSLRSRRRTGDA